MNELHGTEEQEYIMMKMASAKSRRKTMTSSSRLTVVVGAQNKFEGVISFDGRSGTCQHRRFDPFDFKPVESVTSCASMQEGVSGLASKPGRIHVLQSMLEGLGV